MGRRCRMVVYKLFWRHEDEEHFIGILPERRKNVERITEESLVNLSKTILGDQSGIDFNNIHFIQMEV
jgi:hypothetical protein